MWCQEERNWTSKILGVNHYAGIPIWAGGMGMVQAANEN